MDKSTCSVVECGNNSSTRGFCKNHYTRFKATGDPLRPCKTCGKDCSFGFGPKVYCSDDCIPLCEFEYCDRLVSGRSDHCKIHHDGILKYGRPPTYVWSENKLCVVCGASDWDGKGRKTCSNACKALLSHHGGVPPEKARKCSRCSSELDLTDRHTNGRKTRSDKVLCRYCVRARSRRYNMSITVLADRDGYECGICSKPVDIGLRHPNPMSPSVDHVIPRSRGGSDEPENLQLSHLTCNLTKQARIDYKVS